MAASSSPLKSDESTNGREAYSPLPNAAVARICGMSRSRCGYCNGSRLGVLRVRDGHNKVLRVDEEKGEGDANASMTIQDKVDEHNTTKSYGLSFESLPCETYEDMIDRGWRRSGKLLYLPTNTEICCPQITIRLDVFGFEQTAKKPIVECDLAKTVLVSGSSKSQRKVGKLLLRALKVHNNKQPFTRNEHDDSSEEMHKHKRPRSDETTGPVHTKQSNNLPNFELFLQKLSKVVYNTVTADAKKVVDVEANGGTPTWAWWDDESQSPSSDVPKWCSFKISRAQRSDGGFFTVTTSACAAASGRSRHALDRNRLGKIVMRALCNADSGGDVGVSFEGVTLHDKSGHVHLHLKCDDSMLITAPRNTSKSSNRGSSLKEVTDSIDEFVTRQQKFASRLRRSANDGNKKQQQRYLTVRSVPSLESSSDPEVLELFCQYQTAIHRDSDPFFGEIGGPKTLHSDEYGRTKEMNLPGFLDVDAVYCNLSEERRNVIKQVYLKYYRFLCETPVKQDKDKGSFELTEGYDIQIPNGTYHQVIRALSLFQTISC